MFPEIDPCCSETQKKAGASDERDSNCGVRLRRETEMLLDAPHTWFQAVHAFLKLAVGELQKGIRFGKLAV